MEGTDHLDFVISAYAITIVVVGALIAWVMLDYRAQRRALAELDMKGFTRRSSAGRSRPATEQTREDA